MCFVASLTSGGHLVFGGLFVIVLLLMAGVVDGTQDAIVFNLLGRIAVPSWPDSSVGVFCLLGCFCVWFLCLCVCSLSVFGFAFCFVFCS